jgi:hypothetical protein
MANAQWSRRSNALKHLTPECLSLCQILALQPGNVLAVWMAQSQMWLLTLFQRLVTGKDFLEYHRE